MILLTVGATVVDMNLVIQMITAVAVAYAAYAAHHAQHNSKVAKDTALKSQENIQKIEIATNSMKDALIVSTAKEQFAAGRDQARLEGEAKAAILAEGQLNATPPNP